MADISVTDTLVIPSSSAQIVKGTAGATITAGQSVYIDTSDANKIKLADADGSSPANTFAGLAITGAAAGQPVYYCTEDTGGFTIGATIAAGDDVWLSDTPGGITKTRTELETGDKVVHLGVMLTTTTLYFKPVTGGTI